MASDVVWTVGALAAPSAAVSAVGYSDSAGADDDDAAVYAYTWGEGWSASVV